jgi:hypothetical protein
MDFASAWGMYIFGKAGSTAIVKFGTVLETVFPPDVNFHPFSDTDQSYLAEGMTFWVDIESCSKESVSGSSQWRDPPAVEPFFAGLRFMP